MIRSRGSGTALATRCAVDMNAPRPSILLASSLFFMATFAGCGTSSSDSANGEILTAEMPYPGKPMYSHQR